MLHIPSPIGTLNCLASLSIRFCGGMAEWLKAAVLKTVERKFRGFESYLFRQFYGEMAE